MKANEFDKDLFLVAQLATDKVMGPGTYARLNGFDPSKGEFPMQVVIHCVELSMIERILKFGSRYKVILVCGCHKTVTADEMKRQQLYIGKRCAHLGI